MNPSMTKAGKIMEKLRRREVVLGGHAFFSDPQITESMGAHGYDFIWIDGEHSAFHLGTILGHIMAAASAGAATLVRVAWNDPVLVKPILEMGPDGVILPMVSSPEEAERAVEACSYPPRGVRGFGPRRACGYGAVDTAEYLKDVDDSFLRIVQIEHIKAVDALEEILQVPGVDLIMVGPNDLSASVGCIGQTRHSDALCQFDRIAEICARTHKPFGVSLGISDRDSIRDWIKRGATMIGCGDDVGFISRGCRETLEFLNGCLEAR